MSSCISSKEPLCPLWWEHTPSGASRLSWITAIMPDSIERGEQIPPHYKDSLGIAFRHRLPMAGILWVEYFYQHGRVVTLSLTVEELDFAQIVQVYTHLRQCYTQRYGKPKGAVGDLIWQTPDSLLLYLGLSPERNYLHATFSKITPSEK